MGKGLLALILLLALNLLTVSGELCRRKQKFLGLKTYETYSCPRDFDDEKKIYCCGDDDDPPRCCSTPYGDVDPELVEIVGKNVDKILGIIAGIVVFVLVGCVLCCCLCPCCILYRRRQRGTTHSTSYSAHPSNPTSHNAAQYVQVQPPSAQPNKPEFSQYPTNAPPYQAAAPYPMSGQHHGSAPYPTNGAPFPNNSAPYPQYPTSAPYPSAGAPYPPAAPYPSGAYGQNQAFIHPDAPPPYTTTEMYPKQAPFNPNCQ
ncbi:protein shisa-4-like [Artemia franciscana]|uniref:protein shisa-4-like n=1 Tax=Artemia franciscana TaxID=6661 RepID=UPI0032D9AF39